MASAMSASLASARMKSLQPCGSAWMRFSLTSSVFSSMTLCPAFGHSAACRSERRVPEDEGEDALGKQREEPFNKDQQPTRCIEPRQDDFGSEFGVAEKPQDDQQDEGQRLHDDRQHDRLLPFRFT